MPQQGKMNSSASMFMNKYPWKETLLLFGANSEAGAQICKGRKEIYECNIVFKVTPPSDDEVDLMPGNQTFISALQISIQPKEVLTKLIKKKITAIAWDYIQDEEGPRQC